MAYGLILLAWGQVALVVFGAAAARVEEEFGENDVGVAPTVAFLIVDEAAEADEGLLHLLMAVEPGLFAYADIGDPAIGEALGAVVEAEVLAIGEGVVIDGGLDEVTGDVAFVVAAVVG